MRYILKVFDGQLPDCVIMSHSDATFDLKKYRPPLPIFHGPLIFLLLFFALQASYAVLQQLSSSSKSDRGWLFRNLYTNQLVKNENFSMH